MSYELQTKIYKSLGYLLYIVLALVCVIPILILLVYATRTSAQIQSSITLIPGTNILKNWNSIIASGVKLTTGFGNSVFVSMCTTVLSVYFGLLAAYAIVTYDIKGKKYIYGLIVVMVMIPVQLSIIGYYQYMTMLHLLNSFVPLIIPSIASAGTVFFAKQYLDASMVPELIKAARIDGASEFSIYNKIILPIAAPGAFTMAIFAFVASWNDFMLPFTLITDKEKYTLPMLMAIMKTNTFSQDYGAAYLGMAVTVIPVIVVYLCFSKYIVTGISMGSVKE